MGLLRNDKNYHSALHNKYAVFIIMLHVSFFLVHYSTIFA